MIVMSKSFSKIAFLASMGLIVAFLMGGVGLVAFRLLDNSCRFERQGIIRRFETNSSIENIRLERVNPDKCWMDVTVNVKGKGDIRFTYISEHSGDLNTPSPSAYLPEIDKWVSSLDELRFKRQENAKDYGAGKYNLSSDYRIFPFEINTINEMIHNYDQIVEFSKAKNPEMPQEEDIPEENNYYIIFESEYF
jgi:hypothetical protein